MVDSQGGDAPLREMQALSQVIGNVGRIFQDSTGDVVLELPRSELLPSMRKLRDDLILRFSLLLDVTAVDFLDSKEERFEVVYHLLSLEFKYRLRVKVSVSESECWIDSVVALWSGANFLEREVWDMMGIEFRGHPDLRRILMYDEFKGHPLRKDYPVQAKQPRVKLRYPEVENTARKMIRGDLVSIGRKAANS